MQYGMLSGSFVMLRFPFNGGGKASEPPIIYVEGFTGALYLDKPAEIERYDEAFGSLRDSALSEAESSSVFRRIAKEMIR